ncbi:MAG: transketolase family protein [Christensenellales bacterium]
MIKVSKTHDLEPFELRKIYCDTLMKMVEEGYDIIDCEADLLGAIGMTPFRAKYPERVLEVGIAEQSLAGCAAGVSVCGKIPFAHTFGAFASRRACDQVYLSCAYAKANVKMVGSDPGITAEINGGTHQAMEDIAIMRPIPGITIIEPSDSVMLKWALKKAADTYGIFYFRMHRKNLYKIYEEGTDFEIGKANIINDGKDVTIIACGGIMMKQALDAADLLAAEGISARVVDVITIKPLDETCVLKCAKETGAIVSAENHSTTGGLGSAIADCLAANQIAIPFTKIGVKDTFGEVGFIPYLLERFEMSAKHIAAAAKAAIAKK